MSDPPLATFQFLPWVRRGLSASLANPDTAGTDPPARAQLPVRLTVTALRSGSVASAQPAGVTALLYGPGDVVGVDPRHVIRTEPRDLTPNFEASYFAAIEFDHPDFPWMFTPAAPSGARLRPWISLVVLKDGEYTEPGDPPVPLPVINVASASALPDLRDTWAWAHAQVSGELPPGGWAQLLAEQPGRAISRLICPRRLEPDTPYHAFLVPAFEPGRLAGLGQDPAGAAQATPAWPPGGARPGDAAGVLPVRLPDCGRRGLRVAGPQARPSGDAARGRHPPDGREPAGAGRVPRRRTAARPRRGAAVAADGRHPLAGPGQDRLPDGPAAAHQRDQPVRRRPGPPGRRGSQGRAAHLRALARGRPGRRPDPGLVAARTEPGPPPPFRRRPRHPGRGPPEDPADGGGLAAGRGDRGGQPAAAPGTGRARRHDRGLHHAPRARPPRPRCSP